VGPDDVVEDGVVGAGRRQVGVAGEVDGDPGGDGDDDGAARGHAGDGHVVGAARSGHHRGGGARGAADVDVAAGEAGHRLVEDDGEVDRDAVGRVGLGVGLVDGDRRGGGVDAGPLDDE